MNFHIMTLFPEMIESVLLTSITGRAMEKGIISAQAVNIRDFADNKHHSVDDYPYGGGAGMLMQAQPVYDCYRALCEDLGRKPHLIYLSPQGKPLTQARAVELSKLDSIAMLCGHYEGIDERVLEEIVDEEISIGDYVLTGGELPALVLTDCIARMVDGVLPNEEAFSQESHFNGLLEHPQYTKPFEWNGKTVPEVLISGHHANIEKWKREQSLLRTMERRPELLDCAELTKNDLDFLKKVKNP